MLYGNNACVCSSAFQTWHHIHAEMRSNNVVPLHFSQCTLEAANLQARNPKVIQSAQFGGSFFCCNQERGDQHCEFQTRATRYSWEVWFVHHLTHSHSVFRCAGWTDNADAFISSNTKLTNWTESEVTHVLSTAGSQPTLSQHCSTCLSSNPWPEMVGLRYGIIDPTDSKQQTGPWHLEPAQW